MLLYGPDDVPICVTNTSQLGLCPTTLIKFEDYGLTVGDRIDEQRRDHQGGSSARRVETQVFAIVRVQTK